MGFSRRDRTSKVRGERMNWALQPRPCGQG